MSTPGWVSQQDHDAALARAQTGALTPESVQAMIDEQLASMRAEHAQEIAGIQVQLDEARKAAAGAPVTFVPEHAGGPGTEIAETWSAWEQSLAHAAAEAGRAAG